MLCKMLLSALFGNGKLLSFSQRLIKKILYTFVKNLNSHCFIFLIIKVICILCNSHPLPVTRYPLPVTRYPLPVTRWGLTTAFCTTLCSPSLDMRSFILQIQKVNFAAYEIEPMLFYLKNNGWIIVFSAGGV
jgi:hypothetical protein